MKLFFCGILLLALGLASANAGEFDGRVHLRDGDKCGLGGHAVLLVNDLKDKKVRVTIHISMKTQTQHGVIKGEDKKVFDIPPGGETKIGCSQGNFIPVCFYTYEIVSCETP